MVTFEQFRATRRSGQRSDPKIARIADDCLPDISCDQIHTYEFAGFWGGVLEINGKFFWYWPGRVVRLSRPRSKPRKRKFGSII
jgi:hypothetical protein